MYAHKSGLELPPSGPGGISHVISSQDIEVGADVHAYWTSKREGMGDNAIGRGGD
jgi:hypothetical protein